MDALQCIAFVFSIRVEGSILNFFLQHLLLAALDIFKALSTQHSLKYMQGQDYWQYIIVILLFKCSFLTVSFRYQVFMYVNEWNSVNLNALLSFILAAFLL